MTEELYAKSVFKNSKTVGAVSLISCCCSSAFETMMESFLFFVWQNIIFIGYKTYIDRNKQNKTNQPAKQNQKYC